MNKEHAREICKTFNVRDVALVSKRELAEKVVEQGRVIRRLSLELFCENPYHSVFSKSPESQLVPYRLERVRRASQRAKRR